MTSIAVTASICASASEAALLVASFMPFSLDSVSQVLASQDLGMTHRCADALRRSHVLLGTPRDEYSLLLSPHSANIDRARIDHQYGGILARSQPVCAHEMEFWKQALGLARDRASGNRLIRHPEPVSVFERNRRFAETAGNKNHKPKVRNGPDRILRHLEIKRAHQGNPGQESQRQHFQNDGAFACLFRAILPARRLS